MEERDCYVCWDVWATKNMKHEAKLEIINEHVEEAEENGVYTGRHIVHVNRATRRARLKPWTLKPVVWDQRAN